MRVSYRLNGKIKRVTVSAGSLDLFLNRIQSYGAQIIRIKEL